MTVLYLQLVATLAKLQNRGMNPPIFWLQLDNTSRENKNKWTLAFCSWLVHLGWFFEVVISFLPPGHTHVDIDQMFSTYAIWLLSNRVEFITLLVPYLQHAFKTRIPSGSFLQTVYNWKGYFAPHMHKLHGIQKPHVFLVRKQLDNSVGIKFKKWHSTGDSWVGASQHPEEWLKLMDSFPAGHPEPLEQNELQTPATLEDVLHVQTFTPAQKKRWV